MTPDLSNARKLYTLNLQITGSTEFGVSLGDILAGKTAVPPHGARFDVAFTGKAEGELAGTIEGIDYLRMRADGRADMDIKLVITTEGGQKLALRGEGVCRPRPDAPIGDFWEYAELHSSHEAYRWVNTLNIWGHGHVNFADGTIVVHAYGL